MFKVNLERSNIPEFLTSYIKEMRIIDVEPTVDCIDPSSSVKLFNRPRYGTRVALTPRLKIRLLLTNKIVEAISTNPAVWILRVPTGCLGRDLRVLKDE